MSKPVGAVDIPVGRVELFGMVLHIVESQGHFVAACTDDAGKVIIPLATRGLSVRSCRKLMQSAIDLLIDAADLAFREPPSDTSQSTCHKAQTCCRSIK